MQINRRDFLKTTGKQTFELLLFGGLQVFDGANTKGKSGFFTQICGLSCV
jgi:hypothetical protein